MLDVSTPSPLRQAQPATAVVTRAGGADLEVRVWPPEHVWAVGSDLSEAGHEWEAALPDESGLPSSLVLRREDGFSDSDVVAVVAGLDQPGLATLGYLAPDERGECPRVPGPQPADRDRVVFVELRQEHPDSCWQLRGFGSSAALRRLRAATAGLGTGAPGPPDGERSAVLSLPGRDGIVQELVERLDRAGLDGHVRVLRAHRA